MTHPLESQQNWLYWQPMIRIESKLAVNPIEEKNKGKFQLRTVSTNSTCRESIIYNMRATIQNILFDAVRDPRGWKTKVGQIGEVDFGAEATKGQRFTVLQMKDNGLFKRHPHDPYAFSENTRVTQEQIQTFVEVADRICGTASVLLSPKRAKGDWWKTDPGNCNNEVSRYLSWYGADDFLLRHPVLLAIIIGLLRQCALICSPGYGEQVIEAVSRDRVDHILTEADWREALKIANELRPWIEVPLPAGSREYNMSFPIGHWRRFIRLQRAIRRHGFEKVFNQDFVDGWGLVMSKTHWSGEYTFWGQKGEETELHQLLMKLGEPRRRGGKSGKSASRLP